MMEMLCAGEDVLRLKVDAVVVLFVFCLLFVFGGRFVGFVLWVVAVCFVCLLFGCFGLFMTFSK